MMKKRIIIGLLLLAVVLTIAVAANATTATKQIEATYRNIIIMANGNVVPAEPGLGEPFIVTSEGRTYVPIRMAAQAMGLTVEWVDWLNAVKITGTASTSELETLRAENTRLKDQLEACQNDEDEEEEDEEDGDLSDLEDDLNSSYDELGEVEIDDIILDGDEDDVEVTIEVDLDEYEDEWADLSDSDIENLIEDIVDDIRSEFSDDTNVEGVITDTDSGDDLVVFSKDGEDDLEIEYNDEDYRDSDSSSDADDIEEDLEGTTYDVDDVEFELTSVNYDEDNESVAARLTTDDSDSADLTDSDLEDAADEIYDDIVQAFEDEDLDVDSATITFYDDEGDSLESFDYD